MTFDDRTEDWKLVTRSQYDPTGDEGLVTTVVLALAEAKDVDPLDYAQMPPLDDYFDAAALEDRFFDRSETDRVDETTAVTFTYEAYRVAVRNDGWISVYTPTGT